MVKLEWGKKRTCQNCGTKYYDLRREPVICPSCGAVFQAGTSQRGRRSRSISEVPKAIVASSTAAELEETELVVDDLDDALDVDDEVLPEDTNDLIGDEDDMSEVIDTVDPNRDND